MTEILSYLIVGLLAAVVLLQVLALRRGKMDLTPLVGRLDRMEAGQERGERMLLDELARGREEIAGHSRQLREEVSGSLRGVGDSLVLNLGELANAQRAQLDAFATQLARLTESNEGKLEALRLVVEQKLEQIRADNAGKIEEMRRTVDEKLHGALEQRLGESFKLVSERLEQVYRGLGEMQTLASGVGDLKKVLSNVKSRGTWGEVALGNLLDQVLVPEQYAGNVAVREGSAERVEYAIRLPGRGEDEADQVWLPIDAKFPKEDYERLVEAAERADADAVARASQQLEAAIRTAARDIHDKYINPPATTDFAVMFLPTEGLYAEVIRRAGLMEALQREYRVVVAGPTTFAALLNSLQMGFRTLAIQKHSSEVWKVLGAVKAEFGKFGACLDDVKKRLDQASREIDRTTVRTKAIERRLREVESLPATDTVAMIGETVVDDEIEQ